MRGYFHKVLLLTVFLCGCAAQSYTFLEDRYLEENLRNIMLGHADCPAPASLIVENGATKAGFMLYSQCSSTEVTIIALSPFGFSRGEVHVNNNGRIDFNLHSSLRAMSPNEIINATLKQNE